jgi:XTP/dITP diphosphohydrolase
MRRIDLSFISSSRHKLVEFSALLPEFQIHLEAPRIAEPQAMDLEFLVRSKIDDMKALLQRPFFVEHTGLFVDGWNDFPGGLTSNLMTAVGPRGLARMLADFTPAERKARAEVVIGYWSATSQTRLFRGETEGALLTQPIGDGFGWDPLFLPRGEESTFGQMSPTEKNAVSMRGKAAEKFHRFLLAEFRDGLPRSTSKKIFISYSRDDKKWFQTVVNMLSPILRDYGIAPWTDELIGAGDQWKRAIEAALESSSAAILLVSASFLSSEFIRNVELPYILNAARTHNMKVLWFLINDCHYDATDLHAFQAAHDVRRPLSGLSETEINAVLKQATAIFKET